LESLLTGVCVVDMQKKILFWSTGAERTTGHLRHEVIGHSCIVKALLHCEQSGCEFCREGALWLAPSRRHSQSSPRDFFITNPGTKFRCGFAQFRFTMRTVRSLARSKPSRPLSKARLPRRQSASRLHRRANGRRQPDTNEIPLAGRPGSFLSRLSNADFDCSHCCRAGLTCD
jgi:PAS domain-containing protein